jgi:predicted Zn-dependent peptidase
MKTQYSALNTVVCLAGNISSESRVIAKVEKYFSGIKKKKTIKKPPVIEKQEKPESLLKEKKTDQTHFCLGVRGYNLFHPQRYAQELLGLILGGMMSSRLFIKVREELGLAYYVRTNINTDPDAGSLVTQAGVDNGKVEKAISVILREYRNISEKRVPLKELEKAKEHFQGKMSLSLETSDAQAGFYGGQEILEKKILTPEEIYAKINKVTADDILRVARDIFRPERLNLALIGPFKDKRRFQRLLKL